MLTITRTITGDVDDLVSVTLLSLTRTDTGASVTFPVGGVFTQDGSEWSISFTEPVAGLTYAYNYRRTFDDTTTLDGSGTLVDPPVATGNLATLANLKLYLGIATGNTASDAKLTVMLSAASRAIEAYLDRHILSAERTEIRSGRGSCYMQLDGYPIQSVAELLLCNEAVDAATEDNSWDGYKFDEGAGTLFYEFPYGFNNVSVTYTSGYTTVPADIQQACCSLAAAMFRGSERDTSLKSEKLGDYEYVNYGDGQAFATLAGKLEAISPEAAFLLKPYRRIHAL